MQSEYSSLLARRYRQYRRQKSKESAKKKIGSFMFKLFTVIAKALQKAGILRRKVEKIKVDRS
jgi:hypothetical protein